MPNFSQGLVLAVALVIAALGWHLIYERFGTVMIQNTETNQKVPQSVAAKPTAMPISSQTSSEKSRYAYEETLPNGYQCSAGDGLVYRRRVINGVAEIKPFYRDGQLVHCGGSHGSASLRGPLWCSSTGFVIERASDGRPLLTDIRCSAVWHR